MLFFCSFPVYSTIKSCIGKTKCIVWTRDRCCFDIVTQRGLIWIWNLTDIIMQVQCAIFTDDDSCYGGRRAFSYWFHTLWIKKQINRDFPARTIGPKGRLFSKHYWWHKPPVLIINSTVYSLLGKPPEWGFPFGTE